MKPFFIKPVCFVSAVVLAFSAQAFDDESDVQEIKFKQKIYLSTVDPLLEGVKAKAELEAESEEGTAKAELEVEAEGLPDGEYAVQATRISDGTTEILGFLEVTRKEDDDADEEESAEDGEEETEVEGKAKFTSPFTNDMDPFDIEGVTILDANGNAVLTGSFNDLESTALYNYQANVDLVDETAEVTTASIGASAVETSEITGKVIAHTKVVNGKLKKNKFLLIGRGFEPGTVYSILADGNVVGTVTANKVGKIMVKKLPGLNALEVTTVEITDVLGTVLASANF